MLGVCVVKDFFREDISFDTAMSQVTSYAMSDMFYLPPGTIPPMVMPFDPTASVLGEILVVAIGAPLSNVLKGEIRRMAQLRSQFWFSHLLLLGSFINTHQLRVYSLSVFGRSLWRLRWNIY